MRVKTMWTVAQSAIWDWWNDNCMRLSASLAFYTALSLAPMVIIVVGIAGLITERQMVADQLEQQIELLMGPPSQQLVHTILATTEPQGGTLAAMIGIVTLVIGATAVFGELQAALNLIWEVNLNPSTASGPISGAGSGSVSSHWQLCSRLPFSCWYRSL